MWWRVILTVLAFWLIGAHFLRFGDTLLCASAAALPLLMLIKHSLALRILQLALVISAIGVWGISGFDYVQMRLAVDAPWIRLATIMIGVALFTLAAAYWVEGIGRRRKLFA